ncbi:MAG: helix-turn-helix domain-containing protein, partial [Brevibacterium aurantiacum]
TVPAEQWFPRLESDLGLAEMFAQSQTAGAPEFGDLAASVESWLLSWRPQMTPSFERLKRVLDILSDPDVVSLKILAERTDIGERTLQRMFSSFCGVGVKKVLARARVIDAVGAIDRGWDGTLADLGAQFGWFDQSHFSTDFVRVTGFSPAEYAQRKSARIS